MSVNLFGRSSSAESAQAPVENVSWLPRARLRSGGRGDRLLTALIVVTASVLAAAAGFAAWSRHGDFLPQTVAIIEKAPERAAPAPARQTAPAPALSAAPAPVRNVTEAPSIPVASGSPAVSSERSEAVADTSSRATLRAEPTPTPAPATSAPAAPVTTIRTDPAGVPIQSAAREPAPPPLPLPSASPPVSSAPLTNFSSGTFEVLPPLLGESPVASAPAQRAEPPAPAARERPAPPPQRTASASPPPASGGRVAVYLDEYPDQKAAAAALSQKSGAYGKVIGSAGKLTYTRRGNDWRLRVSNLDPATADALCAKLKGAGAPCSVGPN